MNKLCLFVLATIMFAFNANAQIITTIAGNGTHGFSGDGFAATVAELFTPTGVAVDTKGNVYIADYWNNRVRKIDTAGIITTIAGTGSGWYSGDGGPATNAELFYPFAVCVDQFGSVYISDYANNRVRKVNASGIITTLAGNGTYGYSGDNGPATLAKLFGPAGICIDSVGNIYFADARNNRVRKIDISGTISTVAGNGIAGFSLDGGIATAAEVNHPACIVVDRLGNIYVSDDGNSRVRKINTSGIISTVAGNGSLGYSGDGGAATAAQLHGAGGICLDAADDLYVTDFNNFVIRKVNTSGIITTVAGDGTAGYNGDGITATVAKLNYANGICVDKNGSLYIADRDNNRIRKVDKVKSGVSVPIIPTGDFVVYPNPATQTLNFKFPAGEVTIKIMDATGRITDEQVVHNNSTAKVNLNGYTPGLYIYQVIINGKTQSGKVIIEK